jgi:hypothetical protein
MFGDDWLSVSKHTESGEVVELVSAPLRFWVLAILNTLTKEQREEIFRGVARSLEAARAARSAPPKEPP